MELDGAMRTMEGLVDFHEATWIHKYNGKYYLSYSDNHELGQEGGWQDGTACIMPSATIRSGRGNILAFTCSPPVRKRVSPTMAPSCSTKASGSPFYHNSALSGDPWLRSVCVDRLYHNADGTIRMVEQR